MSNSFDDHRQRFLEAMKRAEAIAQQMAKDACAGVSSGREADLDVARQAMEAYRRAKELREQMEAELSEPLRAERN